MGDNSHGTYGDIDKGWAWVALVACYVNMVAITTSSYMAGILYVGLLEEFQEGEAKTALVGSFNVGLLCFASPIAAMFINRSNSRLVICIGSITSSVGFALSAFVPTLDWIILTAGVIVGTGLGLALAGIIVSMGYYFKKHRRVVISVSFIFAGMGMFISAPVGMAILRTYGLKSLFLIMASVFAQMCVFAVLCKPSSKELAIIAKRSHKDRNNIYKYFDFSLLRNIPFVFYLLDILTFNFALFIGILHLPNYVSVNGATDEKINLIMICFSLSNTLGRVFASILISRVSFNVLFINIGALGISGVLTSCFPLYSNTVIGGYIFAMQLGFFMGIPNCIMVPLAIEVVGDKCIPEINGLLFLFSGIGGTISPIIAGYLYDATGVYIYSFVFAGLVLIAGSVLGMVAYCLTKFGKTQPNVELNVTVKETLEVNSELLNPGIGYKPK